LCTPSLKAREFLQQQLIAFTADPQTYATTHLRKHKPRHVWTD